MVKYLDTGYLISNNGHVFNEKTGRELKPQNNGNGYLKVTLTVSGKQTQKYIHRLVAECYLLNKSTQVNHKDGNKKNNSVENLEWCTNSENQIHAHKNGLKKNGNNLWNGKFEKNQINQMKEFRNSGMFYYEIAKLFQTTKGTVHAIVNNKRYKYPVSLTQTELTINNG